MTEDKIDLLVCCECRQDVKIIDGFGICFTCGNVFKDGVEQINPLTNKLYIKDWKK